MGRKVNTVNTVPNTFIGGVASTIPDAQTLATKLDVSTNDIGYFGTVNNDIEAAVNINYGVPAMWNIADYQNITKYLDNAGKATSFRGRLENLSFLTEVWFPEILIILNYTFRYTALVNVDFPKATTLGGIGAFMDNYNLTTVNLPELLTITSGNTDGCFRRTGLQTLNIPKCTSIGTSAFYGIPVCDITCNSFLATSNNGGENAEIARARTAGCTITYV